MSDTADGCGIAFLGFLVGAVAVVTLFVSVALPAIDKESRQWGNKRGRAIQFCIDHGGQWDDANVRCLKAADTITVQVKP